MDIFEAIKKRRSIRKYKDKQVEEEKILKILESARLAPSAKNLQEWRFIVVRDKEKRKKLSEAARNQKFVEEAPVVIVCCAETDEYRMTCGQLSYPIDVAIAVEHMVLTAVEEGLGTCWIGAFYEDRVKEILNIPEEIKVVELLTLGYPDEEPPSRSRLSLEDIVKWENWGG
ncbi:MAG TPA: nitroreductase [Candidatus Omnitrophica bacterium]|nr:MAG: nitroreductase [Candidatus Omnitrophota bacterium]RKY35060.1 MAG: nitroreductase [Candidatus Omnitrophota bacterium]HEC69523.1 nitroreductase [Candidatus Omnitrophota bacterium]